MKKGMEYIGTVIRTDFPNKGVTICEGEKVVVKDALEGQKIRYAISKARKNRSEGRLHEVLERSPLETREPLCPHFDQCGGCAYQRMEYFEQIKMKAEQVKRILDNSGCEDYEFLGIEPSPSDTGYRNKMEFSFGDSCRGGELTLGLHKAGSFYDILQITDCKIVDEDINRIVRALVALCREWKLSYCHKVTHIGYLRHLLLRRAATTGEILVNLVTSSQWEANHGFDGSSMGDGEKNRSESACGDENEAIAGDNAAITGDYVAIAGDNAAITAYDVDRNKSDGGLSEAEVSGEAENAKNDAFIKKYTEDRFLRELVNVLNNLDLDGRIVGILHTINNDPSDAVRVERMENLYGDDCFYEEILGQVFKITSFSFFQTNSFGAERLYSIARDFVGDTKDKVIFDLYTGTGTIAQILAPVASKVIGVEIVPEAVESAKTNAALNSLANCEFICGDVLKVLDDITEKPDIIVLDPPREGINPKAITKIIDYGVQNLVYISCKPTSLANDLATFRENGYKLVKVKCCDMFPQTVHVETVCLLSNRKADSHIKLSLDMDEYYDIIEKEQAENK